MIAEREGAQSIEELLERKRSQNKPEIPLNPISFKPSPASPTSRAAAPPPPSTKRSSSLPSHVKTLAEIVDMDRLSSLPSEEIARIWNLYHSEKSCLSGTMTGDFYTKFLRRARAFPMFLVPLPRDAGYEFFVMQIAGHQVYFTSLLEYKTHGENARPHLVLTHHTEFMQDKNLVLMLGETTKQNATASGTPVMTLLEAQNLVYQMQMFYVTGSAEKRQLVDDFHNKPAELDHQKLIDAIETLG
ncbi:hypothetical protein HDU86_004189 [Geranomyces michiganensis]|nr:hypothetical protein HDU86_004189 [Geranomyces michiganensis]